MEYNNYVSHCGRYLAGGDEIFQCPHCFRIIRVPICRSYEPNLNCTCDYPKYINRMISLGEHAPIGFIKK